MYAFRLQRTTASAAYILGLCKHPFMLTQFFLVMCMLYQLVQHSRI